MTPRVPQTACAGCGQRFADMAAFRAHVVDKHCARSVAVLRAQGLRRFGGGLWKLRVKANHDR